LPPTGRRTLPDTFNDVRVALSGGVGSGKSTVAAMLSERGALVIDADVIAREVVEPGTSGYDEVVARFGDDVVAEGRLDRAALAKIVFNDADALADLNAIIHPRVRERVAQLTDAAPPDAMIVYDVPLLAEKGGREGFDAVVMVIADRATRLDRLEQRGMGREDAEARMAAQASDEDRRAMADEVIENSGTREELTAAVDALWNRLTHG
jgi:dephospho-CoA kinase